MIDPSLLARLREADPETYKQIEEVNWAKELAEETEYVCDEWGHRCHLSLPDCYDEAILQHVLQDAIRAEKWRYFQESTRDEGFSAYIGKPEGKQSMQIGSRCYGNSPAEALLKCYLAAVECV